MQTRLKPPALPEGILHRCELLEKLNKGLRHKLMLISAPAGYGKTTLAVQWLNTINRSYVWFSIDPIHRNPRVFFQYLIKALSLQFDVFKSPFWQIPQLKTQWDPSFLLTHLINQIEELKVEIILILDDYHLIDCDEINDITDYFLKNLPPLMNVMLLSRSDPQLPLARMRAKQELLELRINDLQFDEKETEAYVLQKRDFSLTGNEIHNISHRTEGWITGIQLAVLTSGRNSSNSFNYVGDYLFEELLECEEERLVDFLYKTSVLTYLNASLCDFLLPDLEGTSRDILEELMRKNFFIKAVNRDGEWFRIHSLLLEVLVKHRSCDIRDLHIRGAYWFWEQGQYDESLFHFKSSGDYSLTIHHLELCWPEMERNFNLLTWLKWTEDIPEYEKTKHPLFLSQIAWAHLNLGQLDLCEISLRRLEKLTGSGKADRNLKIKIISARSYLSFVKRDLEKTREYADELERIAGKEDSFTQMEARSYKALALWLEGHLEEAFLSFENFRNEMIDAGVPAFALGSSMALIQIRMQQGRCTEALDLFNESIALVNNQEESLDKVMASLHLRAAAVCFETGERTLMNRYLAKSEELSRRVSLVDYHYQLHQFKALIFESDRMWENALAELDEAQHLFVQTPAIDDVTIEEQKLRLWIRMKKKTTAKKALRELFKDSEPYPSFQYESRLIINIRFTLAFFRDPEELKVLPDLLDQLISIARNEGRQRSFIIILILKIRTLYELNDKSTIFERLCEVLNLVEDLNLYQIILMETDSLELILREYADRLKNIEAYEIIKNYIDNNLKLNLILSPRELDVLQLMAGGLSNKSIAEKLYVAESTIKGHNQRIFQKLNVTKRTEAIVQARKMSLID